MKFGKHTKLTHATNTNHIIFLVTFHHSERTILTKHRF